MGMKTAPTAPEPAVGNPSTTVQGYSNVAFDRTNATYFPNDLNEPVFLGATRGHDPILMHCGRCQYQGYSVIRSKKGWFNLIFGIITFGFGLLVPGLDTHHYCPQCDYHVAVAKVA